MRVYHEIRDHSRYGQNDIQSFRTQSLTFMAHWHHDVEVILSFGGHIPVGINGKTFLLQEGDMAIVKSGDIHYYQGEPGVCDIHVIIFQPTLLDVGHWPPYRRFTRSFFTENTDVNPDTACHIPAENMALMRTCFQNIIGETKQEDPAHSMLMKGFLHLFCGQALRLLPNEKEPIPDEKVHPSGILRMQSAMDWLEKNIKEDISLTELAKHMNTSYHHVSRIFSDATGVTFTQYLHQLRIREADRLLAQNNLSITDIALQCGFNSLRTFNRVYKDHRGHAPSMVR